MFSVVIPSNNAERLSHCLSAIAQHEPDLPAHQVIVINDGLDLPRLRRSLDGQQLAWGITIKAGVQPFVFGRNMNIGLDLCRRRGHDALLLNDDALLETPGGFGMLSEVLDRPEYRGVGIISPTINSIGNPRQAYRAHPAGHVFVEKRMLCFTCVLVRHSVFSPSEGNSSFIAFDERYTGYGMDDDDFSLQARNEGWTLAVLDNVRINHTALHSAYRGKGQGDFRPNMKLFVEKWGVDNWGKTREHSEFAELFPQPDSQPIDGMVGKSVIPTL